MPFFRVVNVLTLLPPPWHHRAMYQAV